MLHVLRIIPPSLGVVKKGLHFQLAEEVFCYGEVNDIITVETRESAKIKK